MDWRLLHQADDGDDPTSGLEEMYLEPILVNQGVARYYLAQGASTDGNVFCRIKYFVFDNPSWPC